MLMLTLLGLIALYVCCQYRSAIKFSSRRSSKHHNTSFSVLRPRLLDQVIDARQRLLNSSQELHGADNRQLVTALAVAGLGRCVSSIGDIKQAVDAYSALIRRYALHVCALSTMLKSNESYESKRFCFIFIILYCSDGMAGVVLVARG